ncbi:MAG: isoprenylcysteine carboxylmethyltransferase family protein [Pyrinomonadaceae bacterium]
MTRVIRWSCNGIIVSKIVVLIKTIIFTFVVPGTVTILIPYWLLSSSASAPMNLGAVRYAGLVAVVIGVAIYCWCAWNFTFAGSGTPAPIDPPKELVVRGLYRYVRNPMYIAVLTILFGEALLKASRELFYYTGTVFAFFFLFVLLYEEPMLTQKFGDSYSRYRKEVPRWIPWKSKDTR